MLSNSGELAKPEQYIQDSMRMKLSYSHTIYNNFAAGFATPWVAASEVNDYLTHSVNPDTTNAKMMLDMVEQENEGLNIGCAQKFVNEISYGMGVFFNPMGMLFFILVYYFATQLIFKKK